MIRNPEMTLEEALYCMHSYFEDMNDLCQHCKYYRSKKVVIDGHEFYSCKEQEAHAIIYGYVRGNEDAKNNTKVISLNPASSSKVYDNYTDKFVENNIRTTQGGI